MKIYQPTIVCIANFNFQDEMNLLGRRNVARLEIWSGLMFFNLGGAITSPRSLYESSFAADVKETMEKACSHRKTNESVNVPDSSVLLTVI